MRKMKTVLWSILVFSLLFSFAASAGAAWYTCTVDMVGATSSVPLIRLTNIGESSEFSSTWFFLRGNANEMLATGLTAASLGKKVVVRVEGIENYSDLTAIYLKND